MPYFLLLSITGGEAKDVGNHLLVLAAGSD
jgi:hypothetical protein